MSLERVEMFLVVCTMYGSIVVLGSIILSGSQDLYFYCAHAVYFCWRLWRVDAGPCERVGGASAFTNNDSPRRLLAEEACLLAWFACSRQNVGLLSFSLLRCKPDA